MTLPINEQIVVIADSSSGSGWETVLAFRRADASVVPAAGHEPEV